MGSEFTESRVPVARGLGPRGSIRWPLFRSSDLFELRYGKALVAADRHPGPVPVYGTNGCAGSHDTPLFDGPGVVLGRKGMGDLGVEWVDEPFWVIDTAYALRPLGDVDLKFAYYLIRHVGLNHLKHGTSNPSLTREAFGAQLFPVPPIGDQRRIIEVLGALDDKIESNRKTVTAFAGVVDTLHARLIRGADTGTLADLGTVVGGGTPRSSEPSFWDPADVAWVTPRDMTSLCDEPVVWAGARHISQEGLAGSSAKLVPAGSVLFTSRATLGLIAIAQQPLSTNQGFITVVPAEGFSSAFVYSTLRHRTDAIKEQANGSTFMEVNKTNFKAVPCLLPDSPTLAEFDAFANPAMAQIAGLVSESRSLTVLRDELLPKLVSGKIRVPRSDDPEEGLGAATGQLNHERDTAA